MWGLDAPACMRGGSTNCISIALHCSARLRFLPLSLFFYFRKNEIRERESKKSRSCATLRSVLSCFFSFFLFAFLRSHSPPLRLKPCQVAAYYRVHAERLLAQLSELNDKKNLCCVSKDGVGDLTACCFPERINKL